MKNPKHYKPKGQSKSNGKQQSKFRSNSKGGRNCDGVSEAVDSKYAKANDVNWYVSDEQMLKDVGNIPFSYAAGVKYETGEVSNNLSGYAGYYPTSDGYKPSHVLTPGLCVLYTRPSFPITTRHSEPVNQAGWKIVSFLKHTISASLPYEGPDVMVMLTGMANVYAYLNFCSRLYAIIGMYSNMNRYTPDAIVAAMGVDPYSLKNNLADFRRGINQIIRKAATLSIPANLKYFSRTAFMYSDIYTGGTAIQDQLYFFTPDGFWKYNETESEGAGLKYTPFVHVVQGTTDFELLKYNQVIQYGEKLLDGLFSSDDVVMISANILRAYGSAGTLKLELLPDAAEIVPKFDIGVLEQIANANVLPKGLAAAITSKVEGITPGWDVVQQVSTQSVSSIIRWDPYITVKNTSQYLPVRGVEWICNQANIKHIINTTTGFTGPDLVIESTRLKVGGWVETFNSDGSVKVANESYLHFGSSMSEYYRGHLRTGSEVITAAKYIYKLEPGNSAYPTRLSHIATFIDHESEVSFPQSSVGSDMKALSQLAVIQNFRFRPQVYLNLYTNSQSASVYEFDPDNTQTSGQGAISMYHHPYFDLDNYALIDIRQLLNINDAAMYTMFNIQEVSNAYRG